MDTTALRNTLGQFATGVCIVATIDNGKAIGLTVNSFASVSLEPPLVLWSIQNNSECFESFTQNKYSISILNENQQDISNRLAQKHQHEMLSEDYMLSETGLPLVTGALATFECEIWQRYDGGDHTILVGKVESFSTASGKPLLFSGGKYGAIA